MDYATTAEIAFLEAGGTWANISLHLKYLINSFLLLVQIGNNSVYILFVAQNLIPIVESSFNLGWSYKLYLAVLFIFFLWLKTSSQSLRAVLTLAGATSSTWLFF